MKIGTIEINGTSYPLCFSARVMARCNKHYGSLDNIATALSGKDPIKVLDETFWILSEMSEAGSKYAAFQGNQAPEPLTTDFLYDFCGMDDLQGLQAGLMATIYGDMSREILTDDKEKGKNSPKPTMEIPKMEASSGTSGTDCE